MKILLILLVLCASGCSSLGKNNVAGGTEQLGKIRTISIISPAEEEQLALAVARARELHAQIRAYDAAILAAKQMQAQAKTKTGQVKFTAKPSTLAVHQTQKPIRTLAKTRPVRSVALASRASLPMRDWNAPAAPVQFQLTRPQFNAELTSQSKTGPMFELGIPSVIKRSDQKTISFAPARVGTM